MTGNAVDRTPPNPTETRACHLGVDPPVSRDHTSVIARPERGSRFATPWLISPACQPLEDFVPEQATMASRTRSLSRDRYRDRSRSLTPLSDRSRSPVRRHTYDSRSPSRSRSPTPRRNGRQRSESRSRSRGRSASPAIRSTKVDFYSCPLITRALIVQAANSALN